MFHRVSLLVVTAAVAIFLSSCGGGGSSSAPPPVVVVPPSGPTTPPPPESPTYDTITSFNRDRAFSDFGVRLETITTGGQTTTVSSLLQVNLSEVGFNFFANPRRYAAFYEREAEGFSSLSSVSGDFSGESFSGYVDAPTNNLYSSFGRINRNGEMYVGQVRWGNSITSFASNNLRSDRDIIRFFNYGISTVPTDLPSGAGDLYQFTFTVSNSRQSLQAAMDLRINWLTGEMIGVGRLPCPAGQTCPAPPATGDVTINAQFDGNGRFQGSIGGPTGYRGSIVGRFYGPRAIEVGGVMRVAGGGLEEAIGSFTARASGR